MDNAPYALEESDGVTVVAFRTPDLVEHVVNGVRPWLAQLVSSSRRAWILDLAQVNFLSSAGLGLIVQLAQKVTASEGRFVVCGANPHIARLFTGPLHLLRSVELFATRDDARRAVLPH